MTTGEAAPQILPCGLCTREPITSLCHHHEREYHHLAGVVARRFMATCAEMRAGGQGLSHDQISTLRKGMKLDEEKG